MNLPSGDLNPNSYPPYLTSTYTCGVTTALNCKRYYNFYYK